MQDADDEHPWIYSSVVTELQCEMRKAKAALREKEGGNAMFKKHLIEYEKIWSEYELTMKHSEKTRHKQLTSPQVNFKLYNNETMILYVFFFL